MVLRWGAWRQTEVVWGDNVIIEITAEQETAAGPEVPQQG